MKHFYFISLFILALCIAACQKKNDYIQYYNFCNLGDKEKHFENIKEILYLRVLENGNIQIPIRYKIDTEHGVEIRLEKNKIIEIGGIAET